MPDAYDRAIAYVNENPDELFAAWNNPNDSYLAGVLFAGVGFDARSGRQQNRFHSYYHCPVRIKSDICYHEYGSKIVISAILESQLPSLSVMFGLQELPADSVAVTTGMDWKP